LATSRRPAATEVAVQRLKSEIALRREFSGLDEAAFLSLVLTWQRLQNLGRRFFAAYGITDAQFNTLMILWDYRDQLLRQHELAQLLLVNQASLREVLDRMERSGWIARVPDPADRRANRIRLREAGIAKLKEVRAPYYRLLADLYRGTSAPDLHKQIRSFDAMRSRIRHAEELLIASDKEGDHGQ
jgi:DNA-binding MarR family transcriptional regulator